MRFLIHSNGPTVPSGYGVQTALLALRLKAEGHEVAISAYVGQQFGSTKWNDIWIYPGGFDPVGNDLVHQHAQHFFQDDPSSGWIIVLSDLFGITNPLLANFNVLGWCPVDHVPVPKDVRGFFDRTGATPIAMSRFGEEQLRHVGHDPLFAPLAVDTNIYKPTPELEHGGKMVTARELMRVPEDAFVVGFTGMNKGWAVHRKGVPWLFQAFAEFAKRHPDAVLFMNTEALGGAGGYDYNECAAVYGVPDHQIAWVDQYAQRLGLPPQLMAAYYSGMDVLCQPSMGEGFCVPLIEAQACGTPVIVSDFSSQTELVGAGWTVKPVALWYEAGQFSNMVVPSADGILAALEAAYEERGSEENSQRAVTFAQGYDADIVFDRFWRPILAELDSTETLDVETGKIDEVAVIVPVLDRPANVKPLVESFTKANDGTARLYFVADPCDEKELAAIADAGADVILAAGSDLVDSTTYAEKANVGFRGTSEPWVFVCGDDVRFHKGWLDAAREVSERFSVIGTADHPEGKGNQRVALGAHADHFFIRRAYVNKYGSSLDGPGTLAHEGYRHFFTDVEIVELAKARRVWTPCLASVVEHLHPDLGKAEVDDTYRLGWSQKDKDERTWRKRAPLVQMQSVGRGKR